MASALSPDRLVGLLRELAELLSRTGEQSASAAFQRLADDARRARSSDERSSLARAVLALYGGMGSFGDLVLQDEHGVLAAHQELDALRSALFEEASAQL